MMVCKQSSTKVVLVLASLGILVAQVATASPAAASEAEINRLLLKAAEPNQTDKQREDAYQSVYEAFSKLLQSASSQSLDSIRRLVGRLEQLVGGALVGAASTPSSPQQLEQVATPATTTANNERRTPSLDEQAELVLQKLDQLSSQTEPESWRQMNEDLTRLVGSLNESYLRNVRRVIERAQQNLSSQQKAAVASAGTSGQRLHQSADRLNAETDPNRQPGFPGFDELITAMDRVQKALANFVRSSTKLITAG